jgi:replicative superfamily II helicase
LPAANFQRIFKFKHFNKAQSVAFRDLYHSDKHVVVTAPTGAGKTTLFELAFLHMLNSEPNGKAVYLAPMKALCSERFNDWKSRLASIGCDVLMMTVCLA